ncbi:MAG: redox-regulated ATPase YchF [Bacteroidetes bacterium]|nr:redox-regulated ATPase YchF [Bacteroidota bacterium]
MGFTCGIIGLPNVGKSTLFNALTAAHAAVANYPFCTIEPNVGIVPVPDVRLTRIGEIYNPEKIIPTTLEFHDIAGLVKGASTGEGLGNQFLGHIRNVDAIVHVVRCFDDENIVHVNGRINPHYDIEIVETELILKDLETVEKRLRECEKKARSGDKKAKIEYDFLIVLKQHLAAGKLARSIHWKSEEEHQVFLELQLLTSKPVLYVCNVHERDLCNENEYVRAVRTIAAKEGARVVVVSAETEAEIAEFPELERTEFLEGLGLQESGLQRVIREGYELLNLITYFTTGQKEVRARTVQKGTTALKAAGQIHSDFERGFIRAEIIKFSDLDRIGSEQGVRDAGLLYIHGRDYILEDGDIMYVRFNI